MYKNVALSGGGTKGIAILGALYKLWDKIKIEKIIGVSISSIISMCLVIGYKPNELYNIFYEIDICKYNNDNILGLLNNYGIDDGKSIMKLFSSIIKQKVNPNITFSECYNKFPIELTIIGTELNTSKSIYYNYNNTPDMKILDAIRISISYPIKFTPVIKDNNFYVDGGLLCPFPINYFPNNDETLGILIIDNNNIKINDFEEYIFAYVSSLINYITSNLKSNYNNVVEIMLDGFNMPYNLTQLDIKNMYDIGIKSAEKFIN